jgi:tRNA dimethylallyltransferase
VADPRPGVVLLMGPTASGKTELAISLRRHLAIDLISVDSAMVYRGMDIGTAKPTPEVLAEHPHALVNICDPSEPYSAGRFLRDARREIARSLQSGRVPLLVGGTMLYFRALQRGLANLPAADPEIRGALEARAARHGWPALHRELSAVDPVAAARIEPTDAQRIQRALEVYQLSGRALSELQSDPGYQAPPWRLLKIGLWPEDRGAMRERIRRRFSDMMDAGFAREVEMLRQRPDLGPDLPAMRAVGYRQIWSWLDGEISREQAMARAVTATAQLAKRQLTWMRSEDDMRRFAIPARDLEAEVLEYVELRGISQSQL